jgi:hypothetical protein
VGVRPPVCSLQVGSDADAKLFPQISKRQGTRPLTAVGGLLACRSIGAEPLPGPTPRILPTSPSDVTPGPRPSQVSLPQLQQRTIAASQQFRSFVSVGLRRITMMISTPASFRQHDCSPTPASDLHLPVSHSARARHAHAVRRVGPELRIGKVRSGVHLAMMGLAGTAAACPLSLPRCPEVSPIC